MKPGKSETQIIFNRTPPHPPPPQYQLVRALYKLFLVDLIVDLKQ